jgi:2'-5' RNA ligase|tara:strand:+ start:5123 stop:5356 length:234 start_codon:yes stop_codon:yes gene_type:complete
METNTVQLPSLHLFFLGEPHDVPLAELDIGDESSDQQIREVAANHFEVHISKIEAFDVRHNRETGDITISAPAEFGD